ncbi:SNF2-related protein [Planctomycetes bacterium Poly30]|uniref:DEAD/DEAH box helicase n=1 Tax=Saltatorellus ferox TaxID=2528018 RepID=UPI0011A6521E
MSPSRTTKRFSHHLRPLVDAASRKRGEEYFESDLVSELEIDETSVAAYAHGTWRYEVEVDLGDKLYGGQCDCPAFEDRGPCKHMWAVALAADAEELDFKVPKARAGTTGAGRKESQMEELERILRKYDLLYSDDDENEDDDEDEGGNEPRPPVVDPNDWEGRLTWIRREAPPEVPGVWRRALLEAKRVEYVFDLAQSKREGVPVVQAYVRTRKKNGEFGVRSELKLASAARSEDFGGKDRQILMLLAPHATEVPSGPRGGDGRFDGHTGKESHEATLPPHLATELMARMSRTGRLLLSGEGVPRDAVALLWDEGEPWAFRLKLEPGKVGRKHVVTLAGDLVRGEETMALQAAHGLFGAGFLLYGSTLARFDAKGAMQWVVDLWRNGPLVVPKKEEARLVENLVVTGFGAWEREDDEAEPPEGLDGVDQADPRGARVALEIGTKPEHYRDMLPCTLRIVYGGPTTGGHVAVDPIDGAGLVARADGKGWIRRDQDFEVAALSTLHRMGTMAPSGTWVAWHAQVRLQDVPKVVEKALVAGWEVRAEGVLYRTGGVFQGSVSSGVDWFDLNAGLGYGQEVAPLPAILEAARKGRRYVRLGDGSFGVLPENWLKSWGLLELAGKAKGDSLRFQSNQGWILDALLTGREGVSGDAGFTGYRERLDRFEGVEPEDEPASFRGELRPYQRLALGWFRFLRDLGLGGCLADDMGLGKTVQVLALLEERRLGQAELEGGARPTLVVAPNSLVFNWVAEAARFSPELRVLDYTGMDRLSRAGDLEDPAEAARWDLIVTTYGTLRRDAVKLEAVAFDYVVLDEATAIKNASSQAAKAARLMRGRHRLALSGTPIENHLGELWSLFEFLNPGMLGASTAFQRFAKAGRSPEDLEALSRALAPFFLRRTKGEVLKDLPEKTEQVVMCELGKAERKRYDEVRAHFRAELLGGGGAAEPLPGEKKIQVLEALLRLRQCACHPALMDESLIGESSAKLDELLPRLQELAEEGHKVLVFSQFTSFLKVLRARLDALGLTHEYLDGSTRKRGEKVERFQTDDACQLFLISIKAGGHGLNLTAADYVFIMDPWWNPAVEAQAVDRAHRMGQVKPVFAYRLIAKDTVEEKVLELQKDKRELAAAVIGEGAGVLRDLTRGDLERLLS